MGQSWHFYSSDHDYWSGLFIPKNEQNPIPWEEQPGPKKGALLWQSLNWGSLETDQ